MTHQGLNDTVQWQNDFEKSGGIQPTRREAPELKKRRLEQNRLEQSRLEQSRQEQRRRLRQIRAPAYALVEEVNEVERRLSLFRSMFDQLVFEYCHLKYSPLATNISQAEQETRLLTSQAVAILEQLRSAYVRQKRELRWRIMNMIEHLVAISGRQKLVEIVRLKNELFAPTISARRRVDAALEVHYALEHGYVNLLTLTNKVTSNLHGLYGRLRLFQRNLAFPSIFRELFKEYGEAFWSIQIKYREASHLYRTAFYQRRLSQTQFAEAWPFGSSLTISDRRRLSRIRSKSKLKGANNSRRGGPAPEDDLADMKEFYFPQSGSQRSHLLELHRRQLDVMAPFFLVDMGMLALKKEFDCSMGIALRELHGMNFSIADLKQLKSNLRMLGMDYMDRRGRFITGYIAVAHTNWLRLKAEERLRRLGGWGPSDQKSLVVSKPVTRNLVLFRGWARKLRDYQETNPRVTLDPEDHGYEESDGSPLLPSLGSDSSRPSITTQWQSSTGDTQAALPCGWFERMAKLEGERAKAEPATHHGPRQSTESQPRQGDGRDPPIQGRNARARSVQRRVLQNKMPRPSTGTKRIDTRMPKFKQFTVSGCPQNQAP
jgi:hypothetical protein